MARMKSMIAALAGLLLVGCATTNTTTTLTERDNGRAIGMSVGQVLVIKLASNPTTGYGWAEHQPTEAVLRQVSEPTYVPDMAPPGMVGVGGTETLEFKAVKSGQQSLQIEYRRPWEKDTAANKVVIFKVSVTP
jgi:inhibitor of cysteine peptidase